MELKIEKVKICVTIPVDNVNEVRNAMCEAGIIGNYTFCSSSVKMLGTFIPNSEAEPYIGEKNKMEYVNEEKLEVICDVNNVKNVIKN